MPAQKSTSPDKDKIVEHAAYENTTDVTPEILIDPGKAPLSTDVTPELKEKATGDGKGAETDAKPDDSNPDETLNTTVEKEPAPVTTPAVDTGTAPTQRDLTNEQDSGSTDPGIAKAHIIEEDAGGSLLPGSSVPRDRTTHSLSGDTPSPHGVRQRRDTPSPHGVRQRSTSLPSHINKTIGDGKGAKTDAKPDDSNPDETLNTTV
eukprot:GHVU01069223.1.p1 GENE.GHVU01069223.1~~GHVU01069223.1.p1  ORF type:complete len:239 (+),score=29.06 GHVU01069223.1:103-717(+)